MPAPEGSPELAHLWRCIEDDITTWPYRWADRLMIYTLEERQKVDAVRKLITNAPLRSSFRPDYRPPEPEYLARWLPACHLLPEDVLGADHWAVRQLRLEGVLLRYGAIRYGTMAAAFAVHLQTGNYVIHHVRT